MKPLHPEMNQLYIRRIVFVLTVLFSVGFVGHLLPATASWMLFLTPGFLLFTSLLVAAPVVAAGGWPIVLWMGMAYAFTFWMEAVGVATGAVFGEYTYGPTLGWAWRGVPLIIAFNWVMVVNGAMSLATRIVPVMAGGWRKPLLVLLTAGGATLFDYIMEPVAIRLNYWTWTQGVIPLQNYAAWFGLAALLAIVHPSQRIFASDGGGCAWLSVHYVVLQGMFFAALRGMWYWAGS